MQGNGHEMHEADWLHLQKNKTLCPPVGEYTCLYTLHDAIGIFDKRIDRSLFKASCPSCYLFRKLYHFDT